jgi:hypothetical protein
VIDATPRPLSAPQSFLRLLRRLTGASLVILVVVPFWRLLSSQTTPIARETTRLTDSYAVFTLRGTALVVALAAVVALLVRPETFERPLRRAAKYLCSWSTARYALAVGSLSGVMTAGLSYYVWRTKPVLIDALAQFIHARYLAEGMLAGPPGWPYEFVVSANTIVTEQGWVSQYPPGHAVVLGLGFATGAVWLVCPLLMAVTAMFTSLVAERLFPEDRTVARTGALLFAVSPYLMSLAASHMSHVTAAALLTVAAYCAVRARDERWQWAVPAGLAVGAAFGTRSLTALVIGAVVTGGTWLTGLAGRERPGHFLTSRVAAAFAGALPFVLAVASYNARFFASPFEFGYTASLGPNHGLGFHPDPFGNLFGPVEGLAYTSSDLVALGYFLVRTPISVVLVAGIFLLVAERLSVGAKLVTAWALSLVLTFAFYWHHDLLLGPRLLSDAAPAWCLLAAVAGLGFVRMLPPDRLLIRDRFSPRVFTGAALLISLLLAAGYFVPRDLRNYAHTFTRSPSLPAAEFPTLIFVHGPWSGRIVATLLGSRMRGDSVYFAISQNSTCRAHEFAVAYAQRARGDTTGTLPRLSFVPGDTDGSQPTTLASGVVVRAQPDEQLSSECEIQARSDIGGTVQLMPLLWQGDLLGGRVRGAMFVRDMGPDANERLIERYPRRRVGVLYRRKDDGTIALARYDEGMGALWGGGRESGSR